MLKNKIELIRDGRPRVLLTWHKRTEGGETIPVAIEYLDELDADLKEHVEHIALNPVLAVVNGTKKRVTPGSSPHFLALPRLLARIGFRVRQF